MKVSREVIRGGEGGVGESLRRGARGILTGQQIQLKGSFVMFVTNMGNSVSVCLWDCSWVVFRKYVTIHCDTIRYDTLCCNTMRYVTLQYDTM